MIKFFRKVRQRMITGNPPLSAAGLPAGKVSKYMIYAIGEIILVVIGILIALQVNNWNQDRHQKASETIYLTQLLEETKADSIFFESRLALFQRQNRVYSHLIQLCEGTLTDSLVASIPTGADEPFVMAALGSATLKSIAQDGEKISDPSVKQSVRHYEQSYEFVSKIIGTLNNDIMLYGRGLLISQPHLSVHGSTLAEYNALCEEEDFLGIMALLLGDIRDSRNLVEAFLTANETLTSDINKYLVSNQ